MSQEEDLAAVCAALRCDETPALSLLQAGRIRSFRASERLSEQGEVSAVNWLVLDGVVRFEGLSSDGRLNIVATHEPGDIAGSFGRPAGPAVGSLVTHGPTRLLAIDNKAIELLLLQQGPLALALSRLFARQAARALDRLASRVTLTANGRIYARLIELAAGTGVIAPAPVVAALAVSVQTTRETASRALSSLERRQIIRRSDGALHILSLRMLEELAI